MANEITPSVSLLVSKTYLEITEQPTSLQVTMSGTKAAGGVQTVGTATHEALSDVSDIGTAGWAYFRNLDSTNYVELGLDSGGSFISFAKLLAGEYGLIPLATKAIYAKANTASVNLRWLIVER